MQPQGGEAPRRAAGGQALRKAAGQGVVSQCAALLLPGPQPNLQLLHVGRGAVAQPPEQGAQRLGTAVERVVEPVQPHSDPLQ